MSLLRIATAICFGITFSYLIPNCQSKLSISTFQKCPEMVLSQE